MGKGGGWRGTKKDKRKEEEEEEGKNIEYCLVFYGGRLG